MKIRYRHQEQNQETEQRSDPCWQNHKLLPNESNCLQQANQECNKNYNKSSGKVVEKLNVQSARIAEHLKLDDRIERLAKKKEFLSLKDHKSAFDDHLTCHLINPSKFEIGVLSKHIFDDINLTIIT